MLDVCSQSIDDITKSAKVVDVLLVCVVVSTPVGIISRSILLAHSTRLVVVSASLSASLVSTIAIIVSSAEVSRVVGWSGVARALVKISAAIVFT